MVKDLRYFDCEILSKILLTEGKICHKTAMKNVKKSKKEYEMKFDPERSIHLFMYQVLNLRDLKSYINFCLAVTLFLSAGGCEFNSTGRKLC